MLQRSQKAKLEGNVALEAVILQRQFLQIDQISEMGQKRST